jgi:hypothetical protein
MASIGKQASLRIPKSGSCLSSYRIALSKAELTTHMAPSLHQLPVHAAQLMHVDNRRQSTGRIFWSLFQIILLHWAQVVCSAHGLPEASNVRGGAYTDGAICL